MARMDNALLAFPLLLFVLLRRKNMSMTTAVLYILLGLIPFISWEIFSVAYYGFPFPNTAYAKIGTSIPLSDYIKRGIKYFVGALFEDTTVLIFPLLFVIQTAMMKSFKYITVSIGIALYYMYLLYIGGDFMFGRHFTVPFFVSVFCLFASLPSWIYCTVTKKLLSSILGAKCGGGGGYNYYCDNGMYGHTVFLNEQ
jgi:arabinofuranosyltransferase